MPQQFCVFISHFAGEHTIASELQAFLNDAFPGLPVFRSSDAHSIPTSQGQYEAILQALRSSSIIIVLLSSESSRRAWMPFETGFAMGRNATVFTLLVRGANPADLPSPFTEMQLREIDQVEIEKLLSAIEQLGDLHRAPVAINALLRGIRDAEASLPNTLLKLEPYMMKYPPNCLSFRLYYEGFGQVTLRTITAGIPLATKDPNWPAPDVPGHLDTERRTVDGVDYFFMQYAAGPPPAQRFPGHVLKIIQPELYPPKDTKDLYELRFALKNDSTVFQDHFLIRCWIDTSTYRTREQKIPMSQINL